MNITELIVIGILKLLATGTGFALGFMGLVYFVVLIGKFFE